MMELLLARDMPQSLKRKFQCVVLQELILEIANANPDKKWTRRVERMGGQFLADTFLLGGQPIFSIDKFDTVYDERGK
jgi:hypothetical protein